MNKTILKKVNQYTQKEAYYAFVAFYIFYAFLIVLFSSKNLPGGIRFFTNKSNSMSPVIDIDSLIMVKKSDFYQPRDIITYYAKIDDQEQIITHRILRLAGNVYLTKGDTNQAIDEYKVIPRLIIGKVVLIIPYLGLVVGFMKTQPGVWLMIVFPAFLIILAEILKIIKIYQED